MKSLKFSDLKIQRLFSLCLGTALTVILLSWALRGASLVTVWNSLRQARWEWLLVGWIAYLASYWVRAWRWGTLLSATCSPGRFNSRLVAIFIGFGANSILPAYLGEFVRAGVLLKLDGIPVAIAVGSIFAERLLDIGVVFLFLLIPIWFGILPLHPSLSNLPLSMIGGTILLIWATFVMGASFPEPIAKAVSSVSQLLGLANLRTRIFSAILNFLMSLSVLRQPVRSLATLLQTVIIWGLNGITYWTALIAFGIISPGFLGAMFTQSATALAIAIPSTPGYVGSFEAGVRFALSIYSIPVDKIIACAIALRFLMYITIPIIAGVIAVKLGLIKGKNFMSNSSVKTIFRG